MAKQLPIVDTNADTFYAWIVKTNGLVQLCNTEVVTANTSANGAVTTGMGYVIGSLGANTVVATELRGGNTISTGVLNITSNTIFTTSANTVLINSGVTLGNTPVVHHQGVRFVTAALTANQVMDTFSSTAYRTAKYVISVFGGGTFQSTEILVLNDGAQTYMTEYATLNSGPVLATFSTDVVGSNVRVLVSPTVGVQINIARTLIAA